jgi:hypothetical protein
MIAAVHALVGAALGRLCRTRTQAALLGGASHIAADMLPHRDLDLPQEAALLAGALALIAAARGADSKELAGAIGAVAPDIENLVGRLRGLPNEKLLLPSHNRCHGPKTDDFHGQLALVLIGLALLLLPEGCPYADPS